MSELDQQQAAQETAAAAQREAELAAREAALAAREEQLAREQAEFEAQQAEISDKKGILNNGDPNFKNSKEKIYDHFPLTVHQMDIIIGVLFVLVFVFIFLGVNHVSFFGLFD